MVTFQSPGVHWVVYCNITNYEKLHRLKTVSEFTFFRISLDTYFKPYKLDPAIGKLRWVGKVAPSTDHLPTCRLFLRLPESNLLHGHRIMSNREFFNIRKIMRFFESAIVHVCIILKENSLGNIQLDKFW